VSIDFDPVVIAKSFALIFPVELPDKTFIATLVLATRFRPLFAWIGVSLAFLVQCIVAVAAGSLLDLLPHWIVALVSAALFSVGAVILLLHVRKARQEESETEQEFEEKVAKHGTDSGLRSIGFSFLVLFAAEWGDLSQLLTANLVARYHAPLSVFVGSWLSLLAVSALAVLLGRALLRWIDITWLKLAGALVCALFAVISLIDVARTSGLF
jgi:putative Ca2+/H+ antiporter (TMEM165/GDT1 family)